MTGELKFKLRSWLTPGLICGFNREPCVKDSAIPSKWYEENLLDKKYPSTFVGYFNLCTAQSISSFATASLIAAFVVCRKAYNTSTPEGNFPLFTNPLY